MTSAVISESPHPDSPVYTLVITEKGGAERREVYRTSELRVGRVQGNDLVLPKGNVSKRHARLLYREGRFIVTDLNSTNGTYVNRRRIAQATIVREGDKVYIGDFVLRVELGERDSIVDEAAVARRTTSDRESSPSVPRVSSVDWDRPSSIDGQRISSGPPMQTFSEIPAPDRGSSGSHRVDELAEAQRRAVARVSERVISELGAVPIELDGTRRDELERQVRKAVSALANEGGVPPGSDIDALAKHAVGELADIGPLQEFLDDAAISAISIARFDEVVIDRGGRLLTVPPGFSSPSALSLAVRRLCVRSGSPATEDRSVIERRLADGTRLSAVMGDVAPTGPLVVLRKPRKIAASLDDLVRRGTISRAIATFLAQCVSARLNILVVGPLGEGAHILLSALCGSVGRDRVVAVSDFDDVVAHSADAARLNLAEAGGDAKRLLDVAAAIPEARLAVTLASAEVSAATLEAMGEGLDGVIAALRASDLRRALTRLPTDVSAARQGMSMEAARAWVLSSFDVALEVARVRDGRMRVLRVAELTGDAQGIAAQDIFRFTVERVAAGGAVEGAFAATGHVPRAVTQMQSLGLSVETSVFTRPPSR